MNPDQPRAALLVTALLRNRRDFDYRTRARVISSVKPFDIRSGTVALDGVDGAFREAEIDRDARGSLTGRSLKDAAAMAECWLDRGVSVVLRPEIRSTAPELHDIGPVFFARGDVQILARPAAAVLNSRRSRSAHSENNWVRNTKSIVNRVLKRGFVIASSYGPISYCIVDLLAKGSPIIVVCDEVLPFMQPQEILDRFMEQYGGLFDLDRTLFISPFPPGQVSSAAARSTERDHLVAALSSVVTVGEIRAGGIMESVLKTAAKRQVPIEYAAQPRVRNIARRSDAIPKACLVEASSESSDTSFSVPFADQYGEQSSYLIHYTRARPGPWPGQSVAEYCQSLICELPDAGHSAFDTLVRILKQGRILGSRRLNRAGFSVTCFTECMPSELRSLVEWRRGLIRWSFEPYGLAFRKSTMFRMEARPVIYAVEEAFSDLSDDLKYLFQLQSADGKQWSSEREWRIRGDVRLDDFDRDAFFVIVRTVAEAEIVTNEFGYATALAGF